MRRLQHILTAVLGAVLMFLTIPSSALAQDLDLDQKGSLTIIVHDADNVRVPGGTLTLYQVGEIAGDPNDPHFELTDDFAGSRASLKNPENRQVIAYLEDYADRHRIEGKTVRVPDSAEVDFSTIPLGLYLVVQHTAAPGYQKMASFLISVPNYDEETDSYVYAVNAYPKSDPVRNPTPDTPDKPGTTPVPYPVPVPVEVPGHTTTITTTTTTTTTGIVPTQSGTKPNTAAQTVVTSLCGLLLLSGLLFLVFFRKSRHSQSKS